MNKKITTVLIIIVIAIIILIVATPLIKNFAKDNTMKLIDYTADSFKEEASNEDSDNQSNEKNKDEDKIKDEFSNMTIDLQIGQNDISINTDYNNEIYEVGNLYTDTTLDIELKDISKDIKDEIDLIIDGEKINEDSTIELDTLSKDKFIEVKLEYEDLNRKYFVRTLPNSFPDFEIHGQSKQEGDYYSNFYLDGSPYVYKMSNEGDILYYNSSDSEDKNGVTNFAKWDIGDNDRYSFFSRDNDDHIETSGYNYGSFVILDENYEEIDKVRSFPSEKYNIHTDKAETHDFIMIDDGHYMLMNYVLDSPNPEDLTEDLNLESNVLAAYVQEIKDDEVVWEWLSTDYSEFYGNSVENNDYSNSDQYAADYMHINSIFIDPEDSNIIMSFRNQDTVAKIDKKTNEILWRFGGEDDDFNLDKKEKPSRQHHATVTEAGNLLIFDNGNDNEQTRIIEAEIDEENLELNDYKEFQIDDAFTKFTGSVQKLDEENDTFLIGWGLQRENQHALMSEIDFKNNEVITEVIDPEIENDSYRFLKF